MSADSTAAGAWSQIAAGDAVSRSIGLVLLAMSVVSWTLILSRSWFSCMLAIVFPFVSG